MNQIVPLWEMFSKYVDSGADSAPNDCELQQIISLLLVSVSFICKTKG